MAKAAKEYHGIRASSPAEALVVASATNNAKALRSLLADGVDVNAKSDGEAPLHAAAYHGAKAVTEILVASGAKLEALDKDDMTALMIACHRGQKKATEVALLLLRARANASAVRRSDGMTVLKFAMKRGTRELVQTLIDAGADVDGPRGTDLTALMLAARADNVEALQVLVENGADVSRKCKLPWAKGRTAEGLAEMEKRKKALAYLRSLPPA
jgi:ankyrin repeat protein